MEAVRRIKSGLAYHYKWALAVIGGMYWDDALEYAKQAERLQHNHYGWMLEIAVASQSNEGYRALRRSLAGKDKPKLLTPKTEAEVVAMLKGRGTDGV